jgi:hypothetical protein
MPTQLDVVEGLTANLDAVLGGGASKLASVNYQSVFTPPTAEDRAVIDWQRSDDGGASWQVIAHSFQNEGNPLPYGTGMPWRQWSVRHGFIATILEQGALLRVRACYTPPAGAALPCVTGPATLLNVLQRSALPAISISPRSVLVRTGQTANLSVTASGLPAPTLQWQRRAANSSESWTNVSVGSGATTAIYMTAPMTLSDNGMQFRVVATNSLGSVESAGATISVSDLDVAPSITTQPGHLTVTSGSDAVFAVTATGTEALSYQWSRSGTPIVGANSAVLRLTSVSNADAGAYGVTVSNDAGDVDSNTAQLTVIPGTAVAVAPTIVTQPASVTVNAGNTATFAVGVDGSGPFAFVWRKDGSVLPGATSAVLTLNAAATGSAGSYSVTVSNAANPSGLASAAATLTVLPNGAASAPVITTQPSTIIVAPGGSGVLAVAATGSGPLSYQWFSEGVPMSGETAAVLTLSNVGADDAGSYAVSVTNSLGSVSSNVADVILLGAPVITASPASVSLFENSTTTFRVEATGSALRYQWLLNGSPLANSNSDAYTTPSLTVADSGAVYSVIVFNGAGLTVSSPAVLTVQTPVPPTILQQPADVSVVAGLPANICMAFGGTPPFSVQMNRWSGSEWTPIGSRVSISDNGVFCLSSPNLQLADNGAQFRFFASNAEGGIFEAMTRTVTVTVTASALVTSTTIVSVTWNSVRANNRSYLPSLSADGRLIAFVTDGTNMLPGFTNPPALGGHAYVYDLITGTVTAINQTPSGTQSIYGVTELKIAANGRYAVFTSLAGDLVAGDTNGSQDVFVRDLQTGVTERINVLPNGSQLTDVGNAVKEMNIDISADGRFVSFIDNYNLLGDALPGPRSLYLRDTQTDQTRLVASSSTSFIAYPALSADGKHLAYALSTPSPATQTILYYDIEASSTGSLFTLDTSNDQDYLGQGVAISPNGRYVAFAIRSTALLGGSTFPQVIAIDRQVPNSFIVASNGPNGFGDGSSSFPKLADDGHVLFATTAPNLTGNLAFSLRTVLVARDLLSSTIRVASRRPNGTDVWTALYNNHALSRDGTMLALIADDSVMVPGGVPDHHVYVAPRP